MAVVDFQHVGRETGDIESSTVSSPAITFRRPAPFFGPLKDLVLWNHLSHDLIPRIPVRIFQMMQCLRGVVPVVHVAILPIDRVVQQVLSTVNQSLILSIPAKVLAAEQTFGGHGGRGVTADRLVLVETPIADGHGVEVVGYALECGTGHIQPAISAALAAP